MLGEIKYRKSQILWRTHQVLVVDVDYSRYEVKLGGYHSEKGRPLTLISLKCSIGGFVSARKCTTHPFSHLRLSQIFFVNTSDIF